MHISGLSPLDLICFTSVQSLGESQCCFAPRRRTLLTPSCVRSQQELHQNLVFGPLDLLTTCQIAWLPA